jgi:hypothetical protein
MPKAPESAMAAPRRAMDWTPDQEDVQALLESAQDQADQTEARVTQLAFAAPPAATAAKH